MDDLVARLRACLDTDERVALAAAVVHEGEPAEMSWEDGWPVGGLVDAGVNRAWVARLGEHIARHDPARVLRWVKAAREILAAYETAQLAADAAEGTVLAGAARLRRATWLHAVEALMSVYGDTEGAG